MEWVIMRLLFIWYHNHDFVKVINKATLKLLLPVFLAIKYWNVSTDVISACDASKARQVVTNELNKYKWTTYQLKLQRSCL